MTIEFFGIPVLLLGLLCLFLSPIVSIYVLLALTVFGASSAITLTAVGGATLTPATLFLPFFLIRFLMWRWPHWERIVQWKGNPTLIWLGALCAYGIFSVLVLGPLFAGSTQVYMIDRLNADAGPTMEPLRFSSGYITQTVYLLGGACLFIAINQYRKIPGALRHLGNALLLLGTIDALLGTLDLITQLTGTTELLSFMRTGGYAQFNGMQEMAGLRRISGSFSEASAFAGFSMPLFAFSLVATVAGFRTWWSAIVALSLLTLLGLSTSSTAYVALGSFLVLALGVYVARMYFTGGKVPRPGLLLALAGIAVAVFAYCYFTPDVANTLGDFFNQTLFGKLESASGVERGELNSQAWNNFLDTFGLGVGLGGGTASSYPLVLLSNVGLPGFVAFALMLWYALRTGPAEAGLPAAERTVLLAVRSALVGHLLAASTSARVIDPGLGFFLLLGTAAPIILHAARALRSRKSAPLKGPANSAATTVAATAAPGRLPIPSHATHRRLGKPHIAAPFARAGAQRLEVPANGKPPASNLATAPRRLPFGAPLSQLRNVPAAEQPPPGTRQAINRFRDPLRNRGRSRRPTERPL